MAEKGAWPKWVSALQIWLGLVLGIAAVVLAGRAIDFDKLWQTLREVQLPYVLLTLVTSLLTPVMKAVRWRWLFRPHRPPLSTGRLASLVVIGQAVNFAIPGRVGELVRAYLGGEDAGLSKAYVLGTLAVEKLLDLVVLALLVVGLIPFIALPEWLAARVEPIIWGALLVSVVAAALLGGRRLWLRIAGWGLRWLPAGQATRAGGRGSRLAWMAWPHWATGALRWRCGGGPRYSGWWRQPRICCCSWRLVCHRRR